MCYPPNESAPHSEMKTRNPSLRTDRGLTLIELLATILIIAVITAVAVSQFSGVTDQATDNAARRTAQIVASTAENALVAGNVEITTAESKDEVVDMLDEGLEGKGIFEGVVFKLKLHPEQRESVMAYLGFESNRLIFDPTAAD